jgi:hypothetical protein
VQNKDTVDSIVEAIGAIASPLVGLELQWDLREVEDYGPDRTVWIVALHAIVGAAGWEHSRFSTMPLTTFAAETLEERREAHRIAGEAADRLHLPLYAPSVEDHGGQGDSAWIRSIEVGPEVPYQLQWEAGWWTDEGAHCSDNGTLVICATSGDEACTKGVRELRQRFRQRPLHYRCYIPESSQHTSLYSFHESQTPIEEIREIAFREAGCPSRIARALAAKAASVTALSLMVAFYDSFRLSMDQLGALARWRTGELSDAELDAELAMLIEDRRSQWDGPRLLRTARREGRSVARCIDEKLQCGEGRVGVVVQVREAFNIGLSDAKQIVERCDRSYSSRLSSADAARFAEADRWIEEAIRKSEQRLR